MTASRAGRRAAIVSPVVSCALLLILPLITVGLGVPTTTTG
jgi:hypothetical protein